MSSTHDHPAPRPAPPISAARRRTMILFAATAAVVTISAIGAPVIAHQVAYVKALGSYRQSVDAVTDAYARLVRAHAAFDVATGRAEAAAAEATELLTDAVEAADPVDLDALRTETRHLARRAGLVLTPPGADTRSVTVRQHDPVPRLELGETPQGMHPLREATDENDRRAASLAHDAAGYELAVDAVEDQLEVVIDLTTGIRDTVHGFGAGGRVMFDPDAADDPVLAAAEPDAEASTPAA
ncbi:hypothetical protein [Microbacterium sp. GXF7504]